jgi:2-oxo-4-hydroxy-4-carboxy-5-ureidoimidazoline decarboxylase
MDSQDATLHHFNTTDRESGFGDMLRLCGSKVWCEQMVLSRPFANRAALHAVADDVFKQLTQADWLEAFSHHPKIGDIRSLRMKFAGNREWSAGEQAGAVDVNESTLAALAEGNAAYEAKFGFIFIVCATGKSAGEMLAILQARLPNEREAEIELAAVEQQKITHLRIDKWELKE